MARISGIDLPRDKRIEVALTYIYGIGPARAAKVLEVTGIDPDIRVKDLTEEQEAKLAAIRGEQKNIEWGSQIRSYVFCPYTMVKDHRTDVETGNVDAVLDGGLDIFINGYLKWISVQGDKKNTEN